MNKIASFIHRTGLRLAQPDILFFTLPLLMGLLVVGTLAQKTIGIYAAEKQFFGAFLYWLGPLPLPAGLSLMGIFLINLTAKFFFKSEWSWHRAGSLLAHFGVLLLILGAIVTTLTAREGYVALNPLETSRTITDYHGRNLVVRAVEPKSEGGHKAAPPLLTLAHEKLKDGLKLGQAEGLPFDLTITKYCFHCEISRRDVSEQAGWTRPGKFMMLNKAPADPQDEKNMTGIEFEIKSGPPLDSDQPNSEQHSEHPQDTGTKYLTFDGFPKPPVITHGGKTYQISIERTTRPLPFSIKLNRFTREFHPGTQMERAFASDVTIIDPGHKIEFPVRIEMNAPLRYRGYTIYQSSFDVADGVESTVLSIVENKGQIFPYISSIIIACGLLFHLVRRMRRSKKLFGPAAKIASVFIVLSAALIVSSCPLFARPALADDRNSRVQNQFDYHDFAEIPVLHEGRVKPLDSLARIELRQFLGREEFDHHAAIVWLAQALFDPAASANQAIFKVENPAIRHMMGLSERARPIYSFVELSPGLKKTFPMVEQLMDKAPASLSGEQKSLLTIHENALEYTQIMRSFSLILPLNVTIPAPLRDKLERGEPVTYLTLKKLDQTIQSSLKQTIAKKGQNPEKYSPTEQQLAMLGWQIKVMEDAAQDNRLMKVITSRQVLSQDQDQDQTQLVAPWEIVNDGRGGPDTVAQLQNWQKLAGAYMTGDAELWLETAQQIKAQIEQQSLNQRDGSSQTNRIKWEIFYNQVNPFLCATSLYAASFAALLLLLSFPQITGQSSRNLTLRLAMTVGRLLWGGVWIMMGAAILLQIYGLGTRIFVLARPPVGTLYESILFVGMVAPLFSLLSELKLNNRLGLLCAAMGGTALGILALTMQTEGDHMKVLGAVLNTQFWLTVHVLCITIGYGWCLVTSILAHLILVTEAWGDEGAWGTPTTQTSEDQLYKLRRAQGTLALTALLFTTIGTILGGIWADQSWGRFWGWDPKENGALLIVLWIVWILHGKIAGQLSVTTASVGYAFLSVIVGVAWIGVNLLGVGLHSYGFTEGLFWGLGVFTLIEIAILSLLVWKIRKNRKTL